MPSLTALPTEIVLAIAELLGPADIKGLSCMNRRLRNTVTHILFRTLSIAMPLVSHLLLEHMLEKYKKFISRIHLHVFLRPNLEEDDDNPQMPSIGGTMKSGTLLHLVNGKIFSHIDSFSIHFDPCQFDIAGRWYGNDGDWGGGHGSGSITVFEDEEDEDTCYDREEEHVWRAQYMQVFAELIRNPNIKKLRLMNLLPRRTSMWDTVQWGEMLGRLTHLDLSIFGAECGGWSGNATDGFSQFIDNLHSDIVKHLTNVTHLRLEGSTSSTLGAGVDKGYDLFPLYGRVPALQSLELKNIVLGHTFMVYLRAQADNLRDLTLHNCMCLSLVPRGLEEDEWPDEETEAEDPVRWYHIWKSIALRSPAVRRVTFLQDEQPPLIDSINPEYGRSFRIVEKMLEEDTEGDLIVWRHVKIDKLWGTVHEDAETNVEEVACGCAYEAYCDLQKTLMERRENFADEYVGNKNIALKA
ncbi:uncharacterized protein B0J16DRAFT_398016 [Fusarium flagelliforme]|uniref:F-box domain-containing protein n=1 Tax=Fusarium flagelliforme TaxID=2675880 RepID=A0A395N471_9HYPO|nr:uncharacterized protein B0J16DRAFT_398016 [Fusarium flagelliforme]KAH7184647.1 hypothetical protein B0J16DRAFT_398016 [Fusarium flagelliforme]RFN54924.1 hypothetical protein FIE12Z_771 [Fusarium flagelliforme]